MDATRVGVAETGSALAVATAFNTAREPISPEELSYRLRSAGLEEAAAQSLIEDALNYGILWPHREAAEKTDTIVLMGESTLAHSLRARLEEDGFQVRIPLEEDNVFSYIHDLDGMYPVLAVDQLHCPLDCANALAGTATTWVPVSLLDNRGVIGPVRIRGQGPCPLCAHLARVDMDPLWNIISTQLTRVRRTPEAVVLDAVAAHTQVIIRRLMGRSLPPGAPTAKPRPGQQWEIDVYGHHQQRTVIAHPRCPVCFGGKTNLASYEPNE
nr:hypothetical protein [Corynebacterium marquesiae]